MNTTSLPVGGRLITKTMGFWLFLVLLGGALLAWRFFAGLGPVTGLNDGYPWGIWIAFDVVTGTALACGGYAVAILVYVLNRGHFHPLIRPAILTSALGYSLAGLGIFVDIGRYWNIYRVPVFFWNWNLNSILLEVALCVMAYVFVLWLELAPAFMERWTEGSHPGLARFARKVTPVLDRAMIWIIALGLLLPTMHQSSLGSVMLLAGSKLHPLWHTPMLPLLFLISCVAMGFGVVVMESCLASRAFNRPRETGMLAGLSGATALALLLFILVRLIDLGLRGRLGLILALDGAAILFLAEMLLFAIPALMLMARRRRRNPAHLFRTAMLIMLAGSLYRFSTYLIAYQPGEGWHYFPTLPEIMITVGFVSLEVLLYVIIVKRFPIIGAQRTATSNDGGGR
jgi:Ni/Fe-hydrogenase subunit HybB-like protein